MLKVPHAAKLRWSSTFSAFSSSVLPGVHHDAATPPSSELIVLPGQPTRTIEGATPGVLRPARRRIRRHPHRVTRKISAQQPTDRPRSKLRPENSTEEEERIIPESPFAERRELPKAAPGTPRRSLFALIGDIPTLVTDLVRGEIDQLKAEMIVKLKALGIGGGIIAGAVVIVLFAIGVLLTAAVLALSLIMPGWLAALIIAVVLIALAAVVGLIGYRTLKQGIPPVPTISIRSLKKDLETIKGMGK